MRLDNASNIYPAALTKRYASIFRMSVTLTETINLNILQQALDTTVKRIPLFSYTLKNGAFWWYLKKLDKSPYLSKYTKNQDVSKISSSEGSATKAAPLRQCSIRSLIP